MMRRGPETGVSCPQPGKAKDCQQLPGAGRGRKECPLEPSEGVWPCRRLDFVREPLELQENTFLF